MRTYISAGKEYNTIEKHIRAPFIKKIFDCPQGKSVKVQISAVGFYRLWINGRELTKGFFAPYISNPDQVVYYDEYAVKEYVKEKDNVVAVLLGNGFGNELDGNIWNFETAEFRAAPKVYLSLEVDGREVLSTDESFMAVDSAITFDGLRTGERYDARLERGDIHLPVYHGCRKVVVAATPKGVYRRCNASPVTVHEKIPPVSITSAKNGGLYDFEDSPKLIEETEEGYIYDFGRVEVGLCKLRIDATAGQVVDMTFGEYYCNGKIDIRNSGFQGRNHSHFGYIQRVIYTCKDGEQEYIPSFTYFGFRYCLVKGVTKEQADEKLLTFHTVHAKVERRAEFTCDNETVNKINECALRSGLGNLIYMITDCPQREKNGWTSEGHVTAEYMLFNYDCVDTLKEWYFTIQKAQREDGALPGIIPTGGWGFEWGRGPQWDAILVELPTQIYTVTADTEFVRSCVDGIVQYAHYVMTTVNEEGLVRFGLPDWCVMGGHGDESFATNVEVTDTLKTIENLKKAKALLHIAGRFDEDEFLDGSIASLCERFCEKYIDGDKVIGDLQTPQALAVCLGLFGERTQRAVDYLVQLIHRTNDHLQAGVMGYRYVLNALADHRYTELAYRRVTQKTWPSWGNLIEQGATTLWEHFTEFEESENGIVQKDGTERLWSLNHSAFGGVSKWFYNYIAGLKVTGAKTVEISPNFLAEIGCASAKFCNFGNAVCVRWKRVDGGCEVVVENDGFNGEIKIGGESRPLRKGKTVLYAGKEKIG